MRVIRWRLGLIVWFAASASAVALDALPRRETPIEGRWVLNTAQSDDAEAMLREHMERARERRRKEIERWSRRAGSELELPPGGAEGLERRGPSERMRRREERQFDQFKRMLNVSRRLRIARDGTRIEIDSDVESRRLVAGSESLVSMPEGELAELRVGWDGEWLVIHRRARNGPNVQEKLRLLRKTDQLEYVMKWRGDTELAGITLRRVFDRVTGEEPVRSIEVGPIR